MRVDMLKRASKTLVNFFHLLYHTLGHRHDTEYDCGRFEGLQQPQVVVAMCVLNRHCCNRRIFNRVNEFLITAKVGLRIIRVVQAVRIAAAYVHRPYH